jgi:2-oxoglutarate/2-oxoacid ferredoxin oxidoreductase subunit beta
VADAPKTAAAVDLKTYKSETPVTWCPGCGDFSVLHATYKAFAELALDPAETVVVSGIGCSGRFPVFMSTYGFHGVHGRLLPTATGVKLANPKLSVVGVGGDGDGLAIGGGHFPHAARRNVDITYLMLDNSTYGLTKGQSSPTTTSDFKVHSAHPYGSAEDALNPIGLALAYNCSFVARGFSGHLNHLVEMIKRGIRHKGFSFLHILSPCVVFNNTYPYYNKRVVEIGPEHDATDMKQALNLWQDPDKIYLGVFREVQGGEVYADRWEQLRRRAQEKGAGNMEQIFNQYI